MHPTSPRSRSLLLLVALALTSTVASGQPGTGLPWTDFGPWSNPAEAPINGVFTEITPHHGGDLRATALAADPQRRVLTLAEWRDDPDDQNLDCALTRRVANARILDMDFGGPLEGTAHIALDLGGDLDDHCLDLAVDPFSRPVVAGFAGTAGEDAAFLVRRRAVDGGIDASFSGDGVFSLDGLIGFGADETRFVSVATDADARVVACGYVARGSERNMLVMRLTASGSLDATFNGTGYREVDFNGGGLDHDACDAVLLLPDGRIVLAGTSHDVDGDVAYGLVRLLGNGTPDATFTADGKVQIDDATPFTEPDVVDVAYDAGRQRLVVAATAIGAPTTVGVLTAVGNGGALDPTFDGDGRRGVVFSDFGVFGFEREAGSTQLSRILMRGDGRFYVAGTHVNSAADAATWGVSDVALARILPSGANDDAPLHGFSGDGVIFRAYENHGHTDVGLEARLRVADRLRDAIVYRGNVVLLSDTERYPEGFYAGAFWDQGPVAPTVAAIVTDRIHDMDFEYDGLAEPDNPYPAVPIPAGYGHYCSVRHPVSGGWGLLPQGVASDPCQQLLDGDPDLVIERAGLYSLNEPNNVLAVCDGGYIGLHPGFGTTPFDAAAVAAGLRTNCVFTAAPAALPVFDQPYSGLHLAASAQSFNHDVYNIPLDVSDYGQTPDPFHPQAHYVDLNGLQKCDVVQGHSGGAIGGVDEPAVDIPVGGDRLALSVAVGRVAWAVPRYVVRATPVGSDPHQREVFVRHSIGIGRYSEQLTTYYAHLSNTSVRRGDVVAAGAVLGRVGTTGASSVDHLHIAALRHKNLSFRASWEHGYGHVGFDDPEKLRAAAFDPWGWRGLPGTDPWAWRFRAIPDFPADSGSWSVNLWKPGEAPTMD